MILPDPKNAVHKAWLYRLLINLLDNPLIAESIYFKGGTCASMLNLLDRFSVDLDFDLKVSHDKGKIRKELKGIFLSLGLIIKYENPKVLQYVLKYPVAEGRNTINIDIIDVSLKSNKYEAQYLIEIDRYANCQTAETMFANKLVAITDRYKKYKTIAGRDIYDVHFFFARGLNYNHEVIEERTKEKAGSYLQKLIKFIDKKVTQAVVDEDLNSLLTKDKFQAIRKTLKTEVLMFLKDDLRRK